MKGCVQESSMPSQRDASSDESSRKTIARREFLEHSLAAAALCGAYGRTTPLARAAEPRANSDVLPFKVIDTHQHLWELKRFRLPWTDNNPAMARDYTMRDYLAAMAGIPIEKSVY